MNSGIAVTMDLNWEEKETVWMLKIGGRVPLIFAPSAEVLLDRNVISTLSALAKSPDAPNLKSDAWWLRFLDHNRFRLNPVLCASEGNTRQTPSFEAFCRDLEASREILRSAFTQARVLEHDPGVLDGAYQLIRDLNARRTAECEYLRLVVPLIAERAPESSLPSIEKRILGLAGDLGLMARSLVVLCVLSCLYEAKDGANPAAGRGIINPRVGYSPEDAFNAVSDLHSLEFLASASMLTECGLVTRDAAVARFWCELGSLPTTHDGTRFMMRLSLSPALFPRLPLSEAWGLIARLAASVGPQ